MPENIFHPHFLKDKWKKCIIISKLLYMYIMSHQCLGGRLHMATPVSVAVIADYCNLFTLITYIAKSERPTVCRFCLPLTFTLCFCVTMLLPASIFGLFTYALPLNLVPQLVAY